jgi:hypothetical protein
VSAIAADLGAVLDAQEFIPLSISFIHGQRSAAWPGPLRDRFDRMLIAQAMYDDMVLVSNEENFSAYGVRPRRQLSGSSLIFQSRRFALWCQPISLTLAAIPSVLVTTARLVCCAAANMPPRPEDTP